MHPPDKARRGSIPAVFDRRGTPPDGMDRRTKREVTLDWAFSGPVRKYGGIRPAMRRRGTILRTTATGHYNGVFGLVAGHDPRAGRLAQLVEHRLYTPAVTGSSPVPPTTHDLVYDAGS